MPVQATLAPPTIGRASLVSVTNAAALAPQVNAATVTATIPPLPVGTVAVPSGTTTVINGRTYTAETPNRAWSAIRDAATATFTVYPGEQLAQDSSTVERAELADYVTSELAPFDSDVWMSMWMKVAAPLIDSPWLIVGQFRAWDDATDYHARSPVFAQEVYGLAGGAVRFQVVTRSGTDDPSTGNYLSVIRYQDDTFQLGRWYRYVYRLQFSRSGGGQLQGWRDGMEVIPASSVPIGYNDALGPNFKFGAYRSTGATQPVTVKYANVEVGTASLATRVTSPLALPAGA